MSLPQAPCPGQRKDRDAADELAGLRQLEGAASCRELQGRTLTCPLAEDPLHYSLRSSCHREAGRQATPPLPYTARVAAASPGDHRSVRTTACRAQHPHRPDGVCPRRRDGAVERPAPLAGKAAPRRTRPPRSSCSSRRAWSARGAPEVNASAESDGLGATIGACPTPHTRPSSQDAGNSVRENSECTHVERRAATSRRRRVDGLVIG